MFIKLDEIHKKFGISVLINGKAKGFDTICHNWSIARNIAHIDCPANWKKYGKAAGPIRNREMYDKYHPDLLIAGDGNTGTADMLRYVKEKNPIFPIIYIHKPVSDFK